MTDAATAGAAIPPIAIAGRSVETRTIKRPDDRRVAYSVFGEPQASDVLIHMHGSGSCRLEGVSGDQQARGRGVRIIAVDRPGYGRSDPWPGRSIADHVDDVLAVADAEGVERFATGGYSGGAPHALACAVRRPERTLGAVMINTAGDRHSPAWRRQTLRTRLVLWLLLQRPVYAQVWRRLMRNMERAAAEGETPAAGFAAALFAEGGRQGMAAVWQELDLFYGRSWALDLAALRRPVLILQGERDPNLGFARGLAALSSEIALQVIPGGHNEGGTPQTWGRVLDAVGAWSAGSALTPPAASHDASRAEEAPAT